MELPPLIVPLAAPYTDDTSTLSEIRVARMMRWHIEQGAAGFLVGSEAAEVTALSIGERQKLTEWVMRESGSRPVYVNITAGTTLATLALAQDAQDCGAAGGLLLPPPGAPLTEDEAKGYMAAVRRHGNLACSWIDPSGALSHLADELPTPGHVALRPLAEKHPDLAATAHGQLFDFWSPHGVCCAVGLLGARLGGQLLQHKPMFVRPLRELIRSGGAHRVAKAVLEIHGIEAGPPRSPSVPLADGYHKTLEELIRALGTA